MRPAGYSHRPLTAKLGIQPGQNVMLVAAPRGFRGTLGRLPAGAKLVTRLERNASLIIAFTTSSRPLEQDFQRWKSALVADGVLWVCWPKRASGVKTDVDENVVRGICLAAGLVDVKVCAIDATWSGLKCVYRLKDRPARS